MPDPFRLRLDRREIVPADDVTTLTLPAGAVLEADLSAGGCWYGHGFNHRQPYPLNREPVVNRAFAVNNIQAPLWFCSAGYAILAETTEILDVRIGEGGDGRFRLACPAADIPLRVFRGRDLPAAHAAAMAHLGRPASVPDASLFGDSLFCTWTQYPRCITQKRILDMARAIRAHDYPCSVLTIDDRWEAVFGELRFGADFPDPRAMMEELHALGFRVLLWVTPFVNREAATFAALAEAGGLVRRKDGGGPALLRWWGGEAGLVDLTGAAGRGWYRERLLHLQEEVGVDGFKIDGGDFKYQPPREECDWAEPVGPSGYVDALLGLFEEIAPGRCESRTAWLSPRRNLLWREGGKDSHWGADNGLAALVRLGLHLALLGYDRLIPDMVPGRVQTLASDHPLPTDELFVRWTEAEAFFPLLQFSYFPWNYAEETAAAARAYARVHKALEGYIAARAAEAAPLLRPCWYDAPAVEALHTVDDQFLLGGDLLAAPVLTEATVARDILLPPGAWRDAWTGERVSGERLWQYPAPCPGIPLFVRAENDALLATLHDALQTVSRGTVESGVTSATYRAGLDRDLSVTG